MIPLWPPAHLRPVSPLWPYVSSMTLCPLHGPVSPLQLRVLSFNPLSSLQPSLLSSFNPPSCFQPSIPSKGLCTLCSLNGPLFLLWLLWFYPLYTPPLPVPSTAFVPSTSLCHFYGLSPL
jgi:hypothetical protein